MMELEFVFIHTASNFDEYHKLPKAKFKYGSYKYPCTSKVTGVPSTFMINCYGPQGHDGTHEVSSGGGRALARWYDTADELVVD